MKKIRIMLVGLVVFLMNLVVVNAAPSYTFTVNRTSIENGGSVTATVTIKNVAAWNVKIISSGNTTGCTSSFADTTADGKNTTKSFSVTCKSSSTGVIGFTLTGDATGSSEGTINLSGSKSVSVVTPTPKSTNNYLSALSVDGYTLSPAFKQDVSVYSVVVPNDVRKIKINGTRADSKATIRGTGEIDLEEGENKLSVVVTAQNGSVREYTINVTVSELDPIEVSVLGKNYFVVRKKELIESPATFSETTTMIDGEEIPSFTSDVTGYVLVGLRDEEGNIELFVYDEHNNTYKLYRELKLDVLLFYPMDTTQVLKGYEETTIEIDGVSYKAFHKAGDLQYYIVYGMNVASGKSDWYVYDKHDNTLQKFALEEMEELNEKNDIYKLLTYILAGTTAFCVLLMIIQVANAKKLNKKVQHILEKKNISKDAKDGLEEEKLIVSSDKEEIVEVEIDNKKNSKKKK